MAALTGYRKAAPRLALRRLGIVLAGAAAALALWAVEAAVAGGVRQPAFGGGSAPQPLTAPLVLGVSLVAGLAAWGSLAVAVRVGRRGRRVWLPIVVVGLLVSLGGPLSGTGVGAGDRLALLLLHLSVAAVVVPLLYRTMAGPASNEEQR